MAKLIDVNYHLRLLIEHNWMLYICHRKRNWSIPLPLFGGQAVSVAVIRYQSSLQVGVTSSWAGRELVEEFSARLEAAFGELTRATAESPAAEGVRVPGRTPGTVIAGS